MGIRFQVDNVSVCCEVSVWYVCMVCVCTDVSGTDRVFKRPHLAFFSSQMAPCSFSRHSLRPCLIVPPSYNSPGAAFRQTAYASRHPWQARWALGNTNVCLTSTHDMSSLSYRVACWTISSLNFNGAQSRQYLHITIFKHHQWPQ